VPEISMPGSTAMYDALKHWDETGLPPIVPRKRLERLLRTHSDPLPGKITSPPDSE
jgi:hypothetical protein